MAIFENGPNIKVVALNISDLMQLESPNLEFFREIYDFLNRLTQNMPRDSSLMVILSFILGN